MTKPYATIKCKLTLVEGSSVKENTLKSILAVFFSVSLLIGPSSGVMAATSTKSGSSTASAAPVTVSNTLEISPVRTDLSITPGGSSQVKLYVTNITGASIRVQPIENDFVAGPKENGEPAIILDPAQYAPTHSLKRFMQDLPASVTVPSQQRAFVTLTITVPKTAQAGGYFGAVRFVPLPNASGASVNLSESVASIILLNVPGPTVERVGLTNFDIQQYGSSGTNFRNAKGISLFMRFQNEGNVQEAPFGLIYVQKGKKVVFSYKFNQDDPKDQILPDSYRRWTIPIKNFGSFGKYTIGATLTYGLDKQQSLDITKTVWIVPTVLIFAMVGGIVGLIVIIVLIWLFLRSYKRRILRHSRYRR